MRTALIIGVLLFFGLPVEARAQLFGRDRERVTLRYRRAAPRFSGFSGCVGPGCFAPRRDLSLSFSSGRDFQPRFFAPQIYSFPRRDHDIDFRFRRDGFGTDFSFRSARGWGGGWARGFDDCPWCR